MVQTQKLKKNRGALEMIAEKPLIIIAGPTASGKSALAMKLAKEAGGQIVSADSMQIYRRMDIGTAKPSLSERAEIIHHMIDVIEPCEDYSVGLYRAQADAVIRSLTEQNVVPIVCGGTGLYISSLLFEREYGGGTARDDKYRKALWDAAQNEGGDTVYALLEKEDPESARTLHPNDVKRVIRALEILRLTGRKKSEQKDVLRPPRREYKLFVLSLPREVLYKRINFRVDCMIDNGLIEEVEQLKHEGLTSEHMSMKAIGYAEVLRYLKSELKKDEMINLIKQNSRNYAKRQITYFKAMPGADFVDAETAYNALSKK